jgi:hypothetical protein
MRFEGVKKLLSAKSLKLHSVIAIWSYGLPYSKWPAAKRHTIPDAYISISQVDQVTKAKSTVGLLIKTGNWNESILESSADF